MHTKPEVVMALSKVANELGIDIEANMPDFIIGRYLYDCLDALMQANKANGEYFALSARAEERGE